MEKPIQIDEDRNVGLRIEDPGKIWDQIKKGTQNLDGHSRGFVPVGPEMGNVGKDPEIKFIGGNLTFKVELYKNGKSFYGTFPTDDLEKEFLLHPEYELEGKNVYKFINGTRRKIAYVGGNGGEFFYISEDGEIKNEDDLDSKLTEAGKIFNLFARALHKEEGSTLLRDELIIRPKELLDMLEVHSYGERRGEKGSSIEKLIIHEKPDVEFEDIGGQDEAVNMCKRFAEQLHYPDVYALQGSEPPRGILLYGPQGTGKTMLAKAIANRAEANFLFVQASDVVGEGLYGQTETVVTSLFEEARKLVKKDGKHVIIFVDEADLILPKTSKNRHEATGRVVGIFAQEMDGVKTSGKITTILATNNPEEVDSKILSRMDEREAVPLPDAKGLVSILEIQLRLIEEKFNIKIARDNIDLDSIATIAFNQKLSGRDVKDILSNLNRKRGQLQLQKLTSSIDTGRIPVPEDVNRDNVIKEIVSRIKSGDTSEIEDLQLPPISEDELIDAFSNGKALLENRKKPLGFNP